MLPFGAVRVHFHLNPGKLDEREREKLAAALEGPRHFADKHRVFTQGDSADGFYIIVRGHVVVSRVSGSVVDTASRADSKRTDVAAAAPTSSQSSNVTSAAAARSDGKVETKDASVVSSSLGPERQIARLGEGDYFGEAALVTNAKRGASVTCVGPVEVRSLALDCK